MKAICRRLRRLEQRVALHADAVSRSAAELLRERRRCRLEAGGQQYEELRTALAHISVPPGRRLSIAKTLRIGRQLAHERNSARALAQAEIPTDIPS
jgi:hypothetical protein